MYASPLHAYVYAMNISMIADKRPRDKSTKWRTLSERRSAVVGIWLRDIRDRTTLSLVGELCHFNINGIAQW